MQILGEVPEGSGADAEVRFRKVLVQRLGQVTEGCGADAEVRRFQCRRCTYPGQVAEGSGTEVIGEVPESSGADT